MSITRRELLMSSALVLARPAAALSATAPASASPAEPITLCWNENPYGPGPAARAALAGAVTRCCRYPDQEFRDLTALLARKEGTTAEQIVTGTGSGELLRALGLIHGRGGGEIIAAQPTYAELTDYAQQAGAALKFVPVDQHMRHDLKAMRAAVSGRTRAIYLCNPNNPTGTALPASAIREFSASLPATVTTIVDEAYMDFAQGAGYETVADLPRGGQRVVVLRTFSKIHGMAGVRCGYAIAPPALAQELASARMSTGSMLAAQAARASLGDRAFLEDTRRRILASRDRIVRELGRLGLRYADPQGNFVFFDTGMPLPVFTEKMHARGILVGRRFAPYETWCRITVGTEPEVQAFLTALEGVTVETRRTA